MIYTSKNCYPECIARLDGVEASNVVSVDTETKTITRYEDPIKVMNDEFVTYQMTFDSVAIEFHPEFTEMPAQFEFHGLRRL